MSKLSAKEAHAIADEIRKSQLITARALVETEWETHLEPRIIEAARIGNYSTDYSWSRENFKEAQVLPYDFSDELKVFLEELGYIVEINAIQGMGIITNIKITIEWRLINE